jgi:hypothetical protein
MTGVKDTLPNYIDNQNVVTDIAEFWEEIAKILEELATSPPETPKKGYPEEDQNRRLTRQGQIQDQKNSRIFQQKSARREPGRGSRGGTRWGLFLASSAADLPSIALPASEEWTGPSDGHIHLY